MTTDQQIEAEIQAKGKTAPRITPADIEANIVHTEIIRHVSPTGQALRWALLPTRNRSAATGTPSRPVPSPTDLAALGVDPVRARREIPFVSDDSGTPRHTTVSYGAEAVAWALLTGGPGWRLVGRLLLHPPLSWPARAVYVLVAANRHRLPGASESCRIE